MDMQARDLDARFDFAAILVKEAGALAHSYFRRLETLTVKNKGPQDVVSEADLNVEVLIRDQLKTRFPEDGFLGEETGRSEVENGAGIWVVDPIDGTQPFISGMSAWCVSIAFVLNGIVEMGFVYAPAREELFVGRRNAGAKLNGHPISVSKAASFADGILGIGYSSRSAPATFLEMFGRVLHAGGTFYREGSGALTLCYVACGRLIGYVEQHINSWDCLGAVAVIEAANGRVSNFMANEGLWQGNPLAAGPPDIYPLLAELLGQSSSVSEVG
jgi:myo-inositol-1(or 4)-monophosphatase